MIEASERQTVLIVDDAPENINILGELLKPVYNIKIATNGEKALKIAFSDNPPDLILLDVVMPGMDGYEVCKIIKADFRTESIPIIFITGKNSEQDEIKGFDLGAIDYVTKPFNSVIVCARVKTHVELKKYRDFLKNTSNTDGLTALANRRYFDDYLLSIWNLAVREGNPLSLILMDIDYFKRYNDHYGHQAGDMCLIQVAQKLSSSVKRKSDLVARYGGEEFVCVLPNTSKEGAVQLAEEFRRNVMSLQISHEYSDAASCVTISQGICTVLPSREISIETLIKSADEALYQSKQNGRNRITFAY